ncbi:MAG TPA: hypothetical protein VGU01_00380 [Sphingomicrobium sp.]|nr:hypothetical protein [Sphingomicrobium sp.]
MTALTAPSGSGRRQSLELLIAWLLACAFMIFVSAHAIANGAFPDPDDIMRLLEVRDWLGGQSWFDVTQYRVNGPAGVPMHWSRLVDVPVAAVILASRPFVGAARAETVALVFVPLLTLGISMLLVHRIALKLMTSRAALVAVAATPFSLGAMKQLRPMRIDHHGWQIVMALLAILACFDERPRRSGVVAGIAMALWLNISLEGLPFAFAVGLVFAFDWLRIGSAYQRLESFVAALAIASVLIFAATHLPSTWMSQQHDVVNAAYLAGFAAASLCIPIFARLAFRQWSSRLVALGVVGVVTLGAMFLVDTHWMAGPFSNLDPLVRDFWYYGVDEGLPMWRIHWSEGAMGLSQPIMGVLGACLALRDAKAPLRNRWAIYLFLLLATAVSSISVIRVATTASVIAMPGTAFLCQRAFRRARALRKELVRAFATAAALLLMTPAYAVPIAISNPNPKLDTAVVAGMECQKSTQVSALQALPTGEFAAPLDITPMILLHSAHHAVATGHHRNLKGMRDDIRLFLEPPAAGEAIVKDRRLDYVMFCPGAPESIRFARFGPQGLAALLIANRPPKWLERTRVPGLTTLQVWRIRRELLS